MVIFTGAGMSTEARLPDFRSASTGRLNNMNPTALQGREYQEVKQAVIEAARKNKLFNL